MKAAGVLAAGALIRSPQRKYLLCHATGGDERSWSIPKGVVEPGETLQEAAMRETREETGLAVVIPAHADPVFTFSVRNKTCFVFLVTMEQEIDLGSLVCASVITGEHPLAGRPEMDAWRLETFAAARNLVFKSQRALFESGEPP